MYDLGDVVLVDKYKITQSRTTLPHWVNLLICDSSQNDQKLLKLHELPISLTVRHIVAFALREIEVGLEGL